jgi:hypothetical protein
MEEEWEQIKQDAMAGFFPANGVLPVVTSATDEQAVRHAIGQVSRLALEGNFLQCLALWAKPLPGDDVTRALDSVGKITWQIHQAKSAPPLDTIQVHGSFAGVILPVPQAKREDGQKPGRMLVLRRIDGVWRPLPGIDFYRPVNRGYKELNAKATKTLADRLDPESKTSLEALISWLEQIPAPAP